MYESIMSVELHHYMTIAYSSEKLGKKKCLDFSDHLLIIMVFFNDNF